MKLGDTVTVTATLSRRSVKCATGWGYDRTWEPVAIEPREGVYIGQRTLSNGHVVYSWEDPPEYTPQQYVRVALVALSLYADPVYVPLDAMEPQP